MRPRFLIFILLIVLLVLALLLWRRPAQPPSSAEQPQATKQSTNAPVAQANTVSRNTPAVAPMPATNQPVVNDVRTPEGFKQYVEGHNQPVDFYGLVIDQDSNPIPGVKIKSGVRHWTMPKPTVLLAGATTIQIEATTGTDGRFELTGATGDGFGIGLTKDGYEAESEKNDFSTGGSYSYANPVTFKMWSDSIHEHLISAQKSFDIVPDGRPYFINLTDGTISESGTGDLKVWIQYTNQIVPGQLYDWSAGAEVINGGLLGEPQGSPMYEAPASGYIPSFESQQQIKGGQRGRTGEQQFYLFLKNGQEYGEMTIGLYAPFNNETPGLAHLSYAINPSGSRILR